VYFVKGREGDIDKLLYEVYFCYYTLWCTYSWRETQMQEHTHVLEDWYTAAAAAEVLTQKSNKQVKPAYLRTLAREKKVQTKKIGPRTTLYRKADVDAYIVEDRGKKAAKAARTKAIKGTPLPAKTKSIPDQG
jgi:hypothetical protein